MEQTTWYDLPDDLKWIRETHLKGLELPPFTAFTLTGNEDCPSAVALYADSSYYSKPVAVYSQQRKGLQKLD